MVPLCTIIFYLQCFFCFLHNDTKFPIRRVRVEVGGSALVVASPYAVAQIKGHYKLEQSAGRKVIASKNLPCWKVLYSTRHTAVSTSPASVQLKNGVPFPDKDQRMALLGLVYLQEGTYAEAHRHDPNHVLKGMNQYLCIKRTLPFTHPIPYRWTKGQRIDRWARMDALLQKQINTDLRSTHIVMFE
jgi:hypothetical protein